MKPVWTIGSATAEETDPLIALCRVMFEGMGIEDEVALDYVCVVRTPRISVQRGAPRDTLPCFAVRRGGSIHPDFGCRAANMVAPHTHIEFTKGEQ